MYKILIESMARTLWVCSYADEQERLRLLKQPHKCAGLGEDWMDIAPETPTEYRDHALRLAGMIEGLNTRGSGLCDSLLIYLYREWAANSHLGGTPSESFTREFGHYLAM